MPLYMSTFDYEPEVWAELVHNPENRTETVSRMLEDAGCKLKGLWYAFGRSDGFALIEAPDQVTSASISIAISASVPQVRDDRPDDAGRAAQGA